MPPRPSTIETPRLRLVTLLIDEVQALVAEDSARAGRLADLVFPEHWPLEPDARDGLPWHLTHLRRHEAQRAWRIRAVARREDGFVVGSVGLKGPPDAYGTVEIGWSINPSCRRRGFGLEAALGLTAWVRAQPAAYWLIATIADENAASRAVAARLGLQRTRDTRCDLPLWRGRL